MDEDDINYWMRRAAEEKQLAAALPKGRPAAVHAILAELYEQAARRKSRALGRSTVRGVHNPIRERGEGLVDRPDGDRGNFVAV